MKIILLLLAFILLPVLFALIRALLLPKKTSVYHGSEDEERSMDYALKLQKMIQVETVSHRDAEETEKFRRLHKVMEELFPMSLKPAKNTTLTETSWSVSKARIQT